LASCDEEVFTARGRRGEGRNEMHSYDERVWCYVRGTNTNHSRAVVDGRRRDARIESNRIESIAAARAQTANSNSTTQTRLPQANQQTNRAKPNLNPARSSIDVQT